MKPARKPHHPPRKAARATHAAPVGAAAAPILDRAAEADQPFVEGAADALDPDLRHRLVSEAAFQHLEERGFAEGSEVEDWAEAEAEVDHTLIRPESPAKDTD